MLDIIKFSRQYTCMHFTYKFKIVTTKEELSAHKML